MPPLLDRSRPKAKNPLHETQGKPAPVSLIAASQSRGTSLLIWPQRPDNGGVSGTGYCAVQLRFTGRLPGPFTSCAVAPFPPFGGSLEPALGATLPVRGLSRSVVAAQYMRFERRCQMPPRAECSAHLALEKVGGKPCRWPVTSYRWPVARGMELRGVVGGVRARDRPNGDKDVYAPVLAEKRSLSGHDSVGIRGLGICTPVLGGATRGRSSTRK